MLCVFCFLLITPYSPFPLFRGYHACPRHSRLLEESCVGYSAAAGSADAGVGLPLVCWRHDRGQLGPVYFFLRELVEQIYYTGRNLNVSGSVISYLCSRLRVELKMEALPITPFIGVENFLYLSDYSF